MKGLCLGRIVCLAALLMAPAVLQAQTVVINEFLASNVACIQDPQGQYDDWIELYNPSGAPVNVGGMYLTDDLAFPRQYRIPSDFPASTTIPAHGYLIVWADGDTGIAELHASFKLDAGGEAIGLFGADGTTLVDSVAFGPQKADVSYGRFPDGSSIWRYFDTPTPGAANAGGFAGYVADTKFSHKRGFYDAAFDVTITCDTEGATIRYTLNGSAPTGTSAVHAAPIPITKTSTLRAAAFKTGWKPSNTDTQTYLFLDGVIHQPIRPSGYPSSWNGYSADYEMDPNVVTDKENKVKEGLRTIPTVCISTSIANLFDASTGIYTYAENRGDYWERPASVEWIYPDGTTGFHVNCGLRMQGGAFRYNWLSIKHSFRLLFKKEYGPTKLEFPMFDAPDAINAFDTLTLRANANDAWNFWTVCGNAKQYIRDEFIRCTQLAMGQRSSHGTFVHLYLNGIYWGLYNPVERNDASFCANYFGGNKDTDWDAVNQAGIQDGNADAWNRLMTQCSAGLGTTDAYQRIQGNNPDGAPNPAYENLLDVENYIDYMILNLWGGNGDWPWNNWCAARNRVNSTGFKFFCWDSEMTLGVNFNDNPDYELYVTDMTGVNSSVAQPYGALRANAEFRLLFADHVHRHLFNDGALTSGKMVPRYSDMAREVGPAIIDESARWGDMAAEPPRNVTQWTIARDWVLNSYLLGRTAVVLNQFRNAGLYPAVAAPVFNINGAYQHGGTIPPDSSLTMINPNGAGTVYYTLDGSDPRLPEVSPATSLLAAESADKKALVPTGNIGASWLLPGFDDSSWPSLQNPSYPDFDGADDCALIGDPASLRITGRITVSAWIKTKATDGLRDIVAKGYSFSPNGEIYLRIQGGSYAFGAWNGGDYATYLSGADTDVGTWIHLVGTYDGTAWNLYRNGALGSSSPNTQGAVPVSEGWAIGSKGSGTERFFAGIIRDVRIYDRALSASEVTDLFGGGEISSGLCGHWKMDDPSGTTLHDSSGNGNDAALQGSPARVQFGPGGVGYDTDTAYDPFIGLDVQSGMFGINASCYIRIPFTLSAEDAANARYLELRVRYDDGFVAYINGTEVQRDNLTGTPLWNSTSAANRPDNVTPVSFLISDHINALQSGENVLAIQGLNVSTGSSDFLICAELAASADAPTSSSLSPSAAAYGGAIPLAHSTRVKARVLSGNEWSALNDALYSTPAQARPGTLAITELQFNPSSASAAEKSVNPDFLPEDFEFIEIKNLTTQTLDLANAAFTDGITFTFPAPFLLDPGELVVVVRNEAAFRARYGNGPRIASGYQGKLNNAGEKVALADASGAAIIAFEYAASRGWPLAADGAGHSYVPLPRATDCESSGSLDYPLNWRAGTFLNGSPGADDPAPPVGVVLNEFAAHTDTALPPPDDSNDWIELYNAGGSGVSLDHYYLSDDPEDLRKWALPAGLFMDSGGFMLFDEEHDFHNPRTMGFGLSKAGEQLILSYLPGTAEDRIVDCVRFKAQENGATLGRHPDGDPFWSAMAPTPGAANAAPNGDVVISEIMYHPAGDESLGEYVELLNPTTHSINLWNGVGTWRLDGGIRFVFPAGTTLPAKSHLVVVSFDPNDANSLGSFKNMYGLGTATVLGPYTGRLSNRVDRIALERPQAPDPPEVQASWVIVDEAIYFDQDPFPAAADGGASALHRVSEARPGLDPINWNAGTPSPGSFLALVNAPATNLTRDSAVLRGSLLSKGDENPTIRIYWGTADGSMSAGAWQHCEDLGARGVGGFAKPLTGLAAGARYYFRALAEDSSGVVWTTPSAWFTTERNPAVAKGPWNKY